ncbi:MAG TPA: hypothetical protein VGJ19_22925 [Streptosporangiaceae bacterium]
MSSGENDEEAAWLDLIAQYDAPAAGQSWPERENLVPKSEASIPDASQVRTPKAPESPQAKARPVPVDPPFNATAPDLTAPDLPGPGRAGPDRPGTDRPGTGRPAPEKPEMQEEHYFPPPPPPLPKLDPVTKGAWAALFGGPAYLLIATAVGWTVPAVAAFFAIGAFVGGFAILVMRMGDEPRDGDGPDDGAVV